MKMYKGEQVNKDFVMTAQLKEYLKHKKENEEREKEIAEGRTPINFE